MSSVNTTMAREVQRRWSITENYGISLLYWYGRDRNRIADCRSTEDQALRPNRSMSRRLTSRSLRFFEETIKALKSSSVARLIRFLNRYFMKGSIDDVFGAYKSEKFERRYILNDDHHPTTQYHAKMATGHGHE